MEFDLITGSSDEGKMGSLSFVQSNKKKVYSFNPRAENTFCYTEKRSGYDGVGF